MVNGDSAGIVQALKSGGGKLMQVSEDESKIRRNPEMKLPEFDDNYKRVQKARTCYVKVLGLAQDIFHTFTNIFRGLMSKKLLIRSKIFSPNMGTSQFI